MAACGCPNTQLGFPEMDHTLDFINCDINAERWRGSPSSARSAWSAVLFNVGYGYVSNEMRTRIIQVERRYAPTVCEWRRSVVVAFSNKDVETLCLLLVLPGAPCVTTLFTNHGATENAPCAFLLIILADLRRTLTDTQHWRVLMAASDNINYNMYGAPVDTYAIRRLTERYDPLRATALCDVIVRRARDVAEVRAVSATIGLVALSGSETEEDEPALALTLFKIGDIWRSPSCNKCYAYYRSSYRCKHV